MTVDDRSFAVFAKANPDKAKTYILSIRDITGISDDDRIHSALDKSRQPNGNFSMEQAVDILLSSCNGEPSQPDLTGRRTPEERLEPIGATTSVYNHQSQQQNPSGPKRPVVDLTDDGKEEDLQRAIAMSLADGGIINNAANSSRPPGVSQEDQDVSKALEASLLESVSHKRRIDIVNPHDRKRDGEWPVGLKNVGQTCWFSAVIQSLFHLPAFRHLVINYKLPCRDPNTERERKILDFMTELRKLFALLIGSQRRYVDPSRAVSILRGSIGGESQSINNQQDVSEFTHKLLDWLEEAFNISDKYSFDKRRENERSGSDKLYTIENMDAEPEKCDKEKDPSPEGAGDGDKQTAAVIKKNPMYNLFYGGVKIEGKNQGNEFSREEPFGQWPLQVKDFSDIHDSLEASTAHEFIDTSSQSDLATATGQTVVRKSGQERWFTQLPPVLLFELSRFQFNQEKCVAEKVNNLLDFPDTIFMDRYLDTNKNATRAKREVVINLKEREDKLKKVLKSYMEYGTNVSDKYPLVNVLTYALDFARSGQQLAQDQTAGHEDNARETNISSPNNCAMQVDSPCHSPASLTPSSSLLNLTASPLQGKTPVSPLADKPSNTPKRMPDGSIVIPIQVEVTETTPMEVEQPSGSGGDIREPADCSTLDKNLTAKDTLDRGSSLCQHAATENQNKSDTSATNAVAAITTNNNNNSIDWRDSPVPRHVSDVELNVLSSCLTRWRSEVEDDIARLKTSLHEIETEVGKMYEDPSLKKSAYKLHAVMVHEGDVNQGHYWAYVYHPARHVWMKFNDNSVTETSWEALKKESAGGRTNTSAYSMVYIDANRPDLTHTVERPEGGSSFSAESLPPDLEKYLMEDNKLFAGEILKWDNEQEKKMQGDDFGEGVLIGDDPECQIIEHKSDFSKSHAILARELTIRIVNNYPNVPADRRNGITPLSLIVNDLYTSCTKRIKEMAGNIGDVRLESFVHYLELNNVSIDLKKRALLEQVGMGGLENHSEFGGKLAKEALVCLQPNSAKIVEECQKWHKSYHNFRIACHYFLLGVERMWDKKPEEAVELFTRAYYVNERLREEDGGFDASSKMLSYEGFLNCFRNSVESLNSRLVDEFEHGDDPKDVACRVTRVLVPAVQVLQARTNHSQSGPDATLLEEVRARWCALLESPMPKIKHEYWTNIFNTVVPDDSSVMLKQPQNLRYPKLGDDLEMAAKYRTVMLKLSPEDH